MTTREFIDQFTYANTKCRDCGGVNHPYTVKPKIWMEAVNNHNYRRLFICLFCIELRLKRPLVDDDFIEAPINYGVFGFHKHMWTRRG